MTSLRCKALYFINKFLVLWSIYLSSSLVHFKNGPEYHPRGTAQVFIAFMRFRLLSLILKSFQVLLKYSFFSFFHLCLFDGVLFQYSQILVILFFLKCSNAFLIQFFYFFLLVLFFPFFIISIADISVPNSSSISLLYILIACIKVASFFFIFCNYYYYYYYYYKTYVYIYQKLP